MTAELLLLRVQATETGSLGSFDFCISISSLPSTLSLTTTILTHTRTGSYAYMHTRWNYREYLALEAAKMMS